MNLFNPPWCQSEFMATQGKAAIDGVDAVASECERVWGVGRLRLIVDNGLRVKFDAQSQKLEKAIHEGDITELNLQCARMSLAWRTLHQAATDAGCKQLDPDVWEVGLKDGSVAVIVRGNAEAHHVLRDGRHTSVYTLDEIAQLLYGFPAIVKAKQVWPGASVVRAGVRKSHEVIDEQIPF